MKYFSFLEEKPLNLIEEHPHLLGCDSIANSLTDLALQAPPDSLIGFWGDWGVGKSRILHLVEQKLAPKSVVFVFNPWKSANAGNWILQLQGDFLDAARKFEIAIKEKDLDKSISKATKEYAAKKRLNFLKSVLGILASQVKVNTKEVDFLRPEDIDMRECGCITWKTTIDYAHKCDERRFFVLIDDLDRCTPAYIRDVLDTVYNKLRECEVTFILATDRNSIVASMREMLPGKELSAANQYLEKLVSIDVSVPSPTSQQIKEFVDIHTREVIQEIDALPATKWLRGFHDLSEFHEEVNTLFSRAKFTFLPDLISQVADNPRRIKRILLRYLRVVEYWNDKFKSPPSGNDAENEFALEAASCLQCAVGFIVLRELRPEFYDRFFIDCKTALIALQTLSAPSLETDTSTMAEELKKRYVPHDAPIMVVVSAIKKGIKYYSHNENESKFELPYHLAALA